MKRHRHPRLEARGVRFQKKAQTEADRLRLQGKTETPVENYHHGAQGEP